MGDNVNGTYLSVSASVGRMGPVSSIGAGIGADISYMSGPHHHGHGQGRGQIQAAPSNDYYTYVWQAIGLASALAMSPFILYGAWKASTFLCHHLRAFGWAWIACFLASLCIAIYMDNSASHSHQYTQSQTAQIMQSDDEAMQEMLQVARGHVHAQALYPHNGVAGAPAQNSSNAGWLQMESAPATVAPSKKALGPQGQAPKSKQQSVAQMNATQGPGGITADCPTVGGAQLITAVGGVFNAESATVAEIGTIE